MNTMNELQLTLDMNNDNQNAERTAYKKKCEDINKEGIDNQIT